MVKMLRNIIDKDFSKKGLEDGKNTNIIRG